VSYRAATCGFCAAPSEALCPRCEVRVCDVHRRSLRAWCATCDAEHREEIELAVMEATLARAAIGEAEDESRAAARGLEAGLVLVGLLYDLAARPIRKRRARARAQKEFEVRSPDEIARQRSLRGGGAPV
jgi:hypothetical protein